MFQNTELFSTYAYVRVMITYICAMIRFALYFITYQRCKINDEAVHIYADGVGTDKNGHSHLLLVQV